MHESTLVVGEDRRIGCAPCSRCEVNRPRVDSSRVWGLAAPCPGFRMSCSSRETPHRPTGVIPHATAARRDRSIRSVARAPVWPPSILNRTPMLSRTPVRPSLGPSARGDADVMSKLLLLEGANAPRYG
jgi:hypothetical protein